MLEITAKCEGIRDYLMNPMLDPTLEELRTGVRRQLKRDRPAIEQAREKLCYENGSGSPIGIPSLNLFSCLVEAGRDFELAKRRRISTKESSLLPAMLTIREEFLAFGNGHGPVGDGDWVVDKRRGRLKDGTAVCIVRPKFPKWGFTVTFEVDETELSEDKARALVESAGKKIGLGDFRPSCRGPFGRFKVTEWTVNGKPATKGGEKRRGRPSLRGAAGAVIAAIGLFTQAFFGTSA